MMQTSKEFKPIELDSPAQAEHGNQTAQQSTTGNPNQAKDDKQPRLIPHYPNVDYDIVNLPGPVTFEVDIIAIGNGGQEIWGELDTSSRGTERETDEDDWEWGKKRIEFGKGPPEAGDKSKDSSPPTKGINWLSDDNMLPSIVPGSRIMEFYYSKDYSTVPKLDNLAGRFLRAFSVARDQLSEDTPVIFLAYGHGALVLEFAIMRWCSQQLRLTPTLPQTKGIAPVQSSLTSIPLPDLNRVAGIVILGVTRETPKVLAGQNTKPKLEGLLEACLTHLPFKDVTKAPGSTPYHSCFRTIVENKGIATQWYLGNRQFDAEAGIPFEVVDLLKSEQLEPTDNFASFWVEDLSAHGTAPLSTYQGSNDPRYISLRVSVRKFWQEFWIFEAIRSGDSDRLEDHLKRYRVDLNKPRFLGETALHIATKNGLRRMVEDLIYYGADLSLKSAQGQTPLQLAVENGDFEMVELLLSNGARPDTKLNSIEPSIQQLLQDPPLVYGPYLRDVEKSRSEEHEKTQKKRGKGFYQDEPQPAPGPEGLTACNSFHITIGNFFTTTQGQEVFDIRTVPVNKILYTTSPQRISQKVRDKGAKAGVLPNTGFTWYHVPANNIDWVEGLFIKLGLQRALPLNANEYRGASAHSYKMVPSCDCEQDSSTLSLFVPFLNVETSKNWKSMAKVIAQAEKMRFLERLHAFDTWDYSRWRENDRDEDRDKSPDACLIRAYLKNTKGLHVRRTLAQSQYSLLSNTEKWDRDQILLKHGKGPAKIVMVDQLWLWIFDDILITSFPQTWGQMEGQGKDYDLLASLIDHIRGPRDDPFSSVFDLAITIIKRCSTIFTSDPKLLLPSPYLMEIFQEALGAVSIKATESVKTFNKNLTNLSMLYDRVQSTGRGEHKAKENKFRRYIKHKIHEPTESEDSSVGDSDVEILNSRTIRRNFRRLHPTSSGKEREKLRKQWQEIEKKKQEIIKIKSEMIQDPRTKILILLGFFNDITTETAQMIETKDIIDQLNPIVEIQKKQVEVYDKFSKGLGSWLIRGGNSREREHQSTREAERQMRQFAAKFSFQCSEVEVLVEKAENIHTTINQTLKLKQMQANASDAQTTRWQTLGSEKQGKTLMVFTVVTIIFLPLSFMTAFFAVPVNDWPKNSDGSSALSLRYALKFIFSLSLAIIFPFLIIVFNINEVLDKLRTLKRELDYELMYADSWWKKIWTVSWLVITRVSDLIPSPLRHIAILASYYVDDLIQYVWDPAKNLAKVIFGSVRKGISKVLGVLLKLWNITLIKKVVSVDPESQNATEGVVPSTGEKAETDGAKTEL